MFEFLVLLNTLLNLKQSVKFYVYLTPFLKFHGQNYTIIQMWTSYQINNLLNNNNNSIISSKCKTKILIHTLINLILIKQEEVLRQQCIPCYTMRLEVWELEGFNKWMHLDQITMFHLDLNSVLDAHCRKVVIIAFVKDAIKIFDFKF